jgi:hypothetical protein
MGVSTELSSKIVTSRSRLAHFPGHVGQKKQSVYDLPDNFLTHNAWKTGKSLDLVATVLVLSSVKTPLYKDFRSTVKDWQKRLFYFARSR